MNLARLQELADLLDRLGADAGDLPFLRSKEEATMVIAVAIGAKSVGRQPALINVRQHRRGKGPHLPLGSCQRSVFLALWHD